MESQGEPKPTSLFAGRKGWHHTGTYEPESFTLMHSNLFIPPSACKIIVRRLQRLHSSRNTEAHKKPTIRIIRGLRKYIYEINLKELGLLVQRKKILDRFDDESLLFVKAWCKE